jgi:urea carboxylase-associated protein 1
MTQQIIHDEVVPAGEGWTHVLKPGERVRITDLEGNQAADTLFYHADDPNERYCANTTITRNGRLYLELGSVLYSNLGRALGTIVSDDCGRHDTLGGACACESNAVRYGLDTGHMHACRDSFLLALARHGERIGRRFTKRDLAPNVNFFMNVPVTPDGKLRFADGVSAPGKHVEIRAEVPLLVLLSNCPQLNNPCNGWNPTPVRMTVFAA